MSDNAGELSVLINGKEVGLRGLLRQLEADLRRTDAAATKAGQGIGAGVGAGADRAKTSLGGLTTAQREQIQTIAQQSAAQQRVNRDALAMAQTFAQASAGARDYATAASILEATLGRLSGVTVRQEQAVRNQIASYQRQAIAARAAGQAQGAFSQFSSAFTQGLAGFVAPAAAAQVAIQGVIGTVQSFADAFVFKAQLDATTESIRLQLAGVRDSNQVFAEAKRFGDQYRFTQQEMTDTVAASVGILRTSTSSFSETASVLARLQVLAPGKTIQDAAFSVRELASGDITSIADQFNIGRDKAYEMRDAIQGGADVVQVLNQYLNDSGIGMDTLAARTKGAMGGMNELKQAQEDLKLAQAAEWVQGPGLAILNTQISVTRGATRLLAGDFQAMGQSAQANVSAFTTFWSVLAQTGSAAQAQLAADRALAQGLGQVAQASTAAAEGSNRAGGAWQTSGEAAAQAAAKVQAAAAEELLAKVSADELSAAKQQLADQASSAAQAVIAGGGDIQATAARLAASSSQVDQLTAAYIRLLAAQNAAGIAGQQRLANQRANTLDLTGGRGAVLGGPGTTGTGDVEAFVKGQREAQQATRDQAFALADQAGQIKILRGELAGLTPGTAEYIRKETELLQLQSRKTGGGGGRQSAAQKEQEQLLKGQTDYQNKSLDAEQEYQDARAKIATDAAKKRLEADQKFTLDRKRSEVSFYQSLGEMKDQKLAQQLSAQYEAASQQASEIARTQGADVAQEYLRAQRESIKSQGDLQGEIAEAEQKKDKPRAEFLKGLLALQKKADAEELSQIQGKGSAIAAEESAAYAAAEQRYAEHLDRMGVLYERKFGQAPPGTAPSTTLPAPPSTPATGTGPATAAARQNLPAPDETTRGPTPVADQGAVEAIDGLGARLEGSFAGLAAAVSAVEKRVGDVESAVRSLKGRSALAP